MGVRKVDAGATSTASTVGETSEGSRLPAAEIMAPFLYGEGEKKAKYFITILSTDYEIDLHSENKDLLRGICFAFRMISQMSPPYRLTDPSSGEVVEGIKIFEVDGKAASLPE